MPRQIGQDDQQKQLFVLRARNARQRSRNQIDCKKSDGRQNHCRLGERPGHSQEMMWGQADQRRHEDGQHHDDQVFNKRDADHYLAVRRL